MIRIAQLAIQIVRSHILAAETTLITTCEVTSLCYRARICDKWFLRWFLAWGALLLER